MIMNLNLKTKIFLDSGNPQDTQTALDMIGFLDGQTTNPSLIAKNPQMQEQKQAKGKLSEQEVYGFYKTVIEQIHSLISGKSVSIEVAADETTSSEHMLAQAKVMGQWIPSAHMKFPTTPEGLKAAHAFIKQGGRVNMTLVFSQDQAAAIHLATLGAPKGSVYVSPFIGRLDDQGKNGMDLIKNILQMYKEQNSHVEVLAASIRSLDHMTHCLSLNVDRITAPLSVLIEWKNNSFPVSATSQSEKKLEPISFESIDFSQSWENMNLQHELTSAGLKKFAQDWNALLGL